MKRLSLFLSTLGVPLLSYAEEWVSEPIRPAKKTEKIERIERIYREVVVGNGDEPDTKIEEIERIERIERSEGEQEEEEQEWEIAEAAEPEVDEEMVAEEEEVVETTDEKRNYSDVTVKRLCVRDIERGGIGYRTGYVTGEMYVGAVAPGNFVPLLDVRGHHLHNDFYAVNIGLIGRYALDSKCKIVGGNIYYDYRQGCLKNYKRLGLGAEVIGTNWDARINGYMPLGRRKKKKECFFDDYVGDFFFRTESREDAFYGFDIEAGGDLWKGKKGSVYMAGGPYFLTSESMGSSLGAEVRIRPQYRDFFALEFSASYDSLFNANYQAEVIVTVPFYELISKKGEKKYRCIRQSQIYSPLKRQEIVPLKRHSKEESNF